MCQEEVWQVEVGVGVVKGLLNELQHGGGRKVWRCCSSGLVVFFFVFQGKKI